MQGSPSKTIELVLIGGGHSHALALRHFAMHPIPEVSVTLISDRGVTPYSGMLPGYLAGKYTYDECHIDLRRLMHAVNGQFWMDTVTRIDPERQRVHCYQHPSLRYDWLSIDTGSTPIIPDIPGASNYGIPVKPWQPFLESWTRWTNRLREVPKSVTLIIVGGGAGGIELALNAEAKLAEILAPCRCTWTIHVVHRRAQILPGHNAWVQRHCHHLLQKREIQLHLNCRVSAVTRDHLIGSDGLQLSYDQLFWVTGAAAPSWLQATELELSPSGFIQVDNNLRSRSHPNIFATGDVATMVNYPRPKAGVFAVRQGKPLTQNLRRVIAGQHPLPFKPQRNFLSLIGTGDNRAIASWGDIPIGLSAAWLWRWKDRIDRKFMDQFAALSAETMTPSRQESSQRNESNLMHCAGCGSKVGGVVLESVLAQIKQTATSADVLIGLDGEDAAVIQPPPGLAMAQTVDYFRQLINDPYLFGQIATHHALSDLYAMAAEPHTALAIATLPYGSPRHHKNLLYQLLSGSVQVLNRAGAVLIGGHTIEGEALAFGLSCNGLIEPELLLRKSSFRGDEILILTQALGTGVLFAQQEKTKSLWVESALEAMLRSNQAAGKIARQFATACTDITGFGLLGHLWEMVRASNVEATVYLDELPTLPGAVALSQQGIRSSLFEQNSGVLAHVQSEQSLEAHERWPLLVDPQTSGGLLLAVPAARADTCHQALIAAGYDSCCQIGSVTPGPARVRLARCHT
ncbi:MAG: selenide, water dikinase SelD [Cyanobacteria bacterium P01_F01_bin.42]